MSEYHRFFESDHLNDYGVALAADAARLEQMQALPEEVLRHIEECTDCQLRIMQITDLMKDQPVHPGIPRPMLEPVRKSTERPVFWYRAAAVLLIAAAAGTLYFLRDDQATTDRPNSISHSQSSEQLPIPAEEPKTGNTDLLLAERLEPSPNLDDLIQTEFRSAGIEAITPRNGETVQTPVTFRWKSEDRELKLKILTNKEVTILTAIVTADSFVTSKKFEPGLYYWKLEAGDELLFIGKFFVR